MDRLTKYSNETSHKNGVCCTHFLSDECRALGGECAHGCKWEEAAWERLAAYEETELTPEEIERSKLEIEAGCVKAIARTYGIDINRLRKLAEADRAGRLAVLPCKPGDTVYEVTSRKTISEYRVKAIRLELFCTFVEWDIVAGFVDKSIFGVPVDEIGKTVFLTHEEAEKALEAKRDGSTSM